MELKGTEKQVKWAEDIRRELIDGIETEAAKFENRKCKTDEMKERAVMMANSYRRALDSYLNRKLENEKVRRESAEWWINNRDNHFSIVHKWAMENFDKAVAKN